MEFELHNDRAVLRRRNPGRGERAVDRAYGILRGQGRTDELLSELRGPAPLRQRAR